MTSTTTTKSVFAQLMSSKKFMTMLLSLVATVLTMLAGKYLAMSEAAATELVQQLITLAVTYIAGQSAVDASINIGAGLKKPVIDTTIVKE